MRLLPHVCLCETGKPGNWKVCMEIAHWRIYSDMGAITYCTRHKIMVEKKLGTQRILEHFKPAPFAEFRKIE